jgi:chromate transporter
MADTGIGSSPAVNAILDGIAAAAIGLTFATGLQLSPSGAGRLGQLTVTLATVLCVGLLRWPMVPVVLGLAPISIGLALAQRRNA